MASRPDQHLRSVPDPAAQPPPHSIEAEEALLGALIINRAQARAAMGELAEQLAAEDFYRPAHRTVFTAVEDLAARGVPVEAVTLVEELRQRGELADVGGAPFIHTLMEGVPAVANAGHYAGIVHRDGQLRRLADRAQILLQQVKEPGVDPDLMAHRHARQVLELVAPPPSAPEERPAGPVLGREALYGLAGDVVRTLEPHTEADPAGLLVNLLAGFGNLVGPGPYALVHRERHTPRLYVVVVGQSAKARKGTSWSVTRPLLEQAAPDWASRIQGGIASGEGLVHAVRDERTDAKGDLVDAGAIDKRLLAFAPEFGRVLAVAGRDGSVLSQLIREAWDGEGRLQVMTKNDPLLASSSHITILGQITREELLADLTDVETANGFANRFLFALVRRSKFLPRGTGPGYHPGIIDPLVDRLRDAAKAAATIGLMGRSKDAEEFWDELYYELERDTGATGLTAAITVRSSPMVLRLSMIYALLDGSPVIDLPHLRAAHAVWRYSEASVQEIFGEALGDEVADQLLAELRAVLPAGLSLDEQASRFSYRYTSKRLAAARALLERAGLARTVTEQTRGRPRHVTYASPGGASGARRPR